MKLTKIVSPKVVSGLMWLLMSIINPCCLFGFVITALVVMFLCYEGLLVKSTHETIEKYFQDYNSFTEYFTSAFFGVLLFPVYVTLLFCKQ